MNSLVTKRITRHMDFLVKEIGERPGGSPGCLRAEDYIFDCFTANGWITEKQTFACPDWKDLGSTLLLNGRPLAAVTNAFSPSCNVQAGIVPLGSLSELETADLDGRIGVTYGALLPVPLSPKSWFLKSERDDRIIQQLESKKPRALITIQGIGGGVERLIEDWELAIPSVTVSAEVGKELLLADSPRLELIIASTREPGITSNIVGRSGSKRRRVVLCAHHDTKYGTPGACDNASGVATILTLSEFLSTKDYPFMVELVSFTNEEYLPIGDDEYLRRNGGDDLGDVIACINIDGVGQLLAPDSITAVSAGQAFEDALIRLAQSRGDLEWVDPWPESNHSTFSFRGVPSVAFTSTNRVALAHHPYDDLSWASMDRIGRLVSIIKRILDLLATNPSGWTRGETEIQA
jgi:aminopeptidase YwaD